MGINAVVVALGLLVVSPASLAGPLLEPTGEDVREASITPPYDFDADGDIVVWRQDIRALLRRDSLDAAGDALATKYGFAEADMRRLVRAWVIAKAHRHEFDQAWVPDVRAELFALAPLVRRQPLGLAIIAEALEATTEDCSGDDFNALTKGSADLAADGFVIATSLRCIGNFARAALAGGERGVPALIRAAEYGGLPPRDALPLYAWLTSPAALAHVREGDRFAVSVILWQQYLTELLDADLGVHALAVFDTLSVELRTAVVSSSSRPKQTVVVDGIAMTFAGRDKPGDNLIIQIAEAMAMAGREGEARSLLVTLPGLAEAKAFVTCQFAWTRSTKSPCTGADHLPMGALSLDHLLNEPGTDPYPIAETTLSGSFHLGLGVSASGAVRCRVFPKSEYGDICPQGHDDSYFGQTTTKSEELAVAEAAFIQLIPNFGQVRASIQRAHDATVSVVAKPEGVDRSTAAIPPDFAEKPIPALYLGAATRGVLKGLAPLPNGFELVRVERADQRVIAISVSQTYDPTGEVSQGGYWVHVSEDGGKHWQRPLYTGLADRFPYVVQPTSRLPLIVGDTLQLAVDISEIDTASITYPPVGLRSRRQAKNRYLTIPLAALRQDSDGDGLTDIAAHHLLLDRPNTGTSTPFVLGSDYDADCRTPPSVEKLALIQLLGYMTSPSGAAIVEPVDRPAGEVMTGLRGAAAAGDQPLFLIGNRQDYACLGSHRMIIVYDKADIAAVNQFTPDFHALEMPRIVFNRARDRGYVRWSMGWVGGTYRLRLVAGKWQFDSIERWIT